MANTVAVIIPVYKTTLSKTELMAVNQCLRILHNYPIIFIGPNNLDVTTYRNICGDKVVFNFKGFDQQYFDNIAGYNKLMLSPFFYKAFIQYRYILIHQTDAYVFKDELSYWCSMGYDFIGAPQTPHQNASGEMQFLKGYAKFIALVNRLFKTNRQISNVGNGGFSLRKTRKTLIILRLLKSKIDNWGTNNEDGFFKYWGNLLYPFFKLPPDNVALRFAIERSPAESLKQLAPGLPFGCHAFDKYEPETWAPYLN